MGHGVLLGGGGIVCGIVSVATSGGGGSIDAGIVMQKCRLRVRKLLDRQLYFLSC